MMIIIIYERFCIAHYNIIVVVISLLHYDRMNITHCACNAAEVYCCTCNSWACSGPDADSARSVWPSVEAECRRRRRRRRRTTRRATGTTGRDELRRSPARRKGFTRRRPRAHGKRNARRTRATECARKELFRIARPSSNPGGWRAKLSHTAHLFVLYPHSHAYARTLKLVSNTWSPPHQSIERVFWFFWFFTKLQNVFLY